MVLSNYNCAQAELYKICRIIWLLCQEHLTEFADYKSIYTAAFIAENLALINTVKAMPDYEERMKPVKASQQDLVAERQDASDFYRLLFGYCTTAFESDPSFRESMYEEAGKSYFDKVGGGSWKEISGLLTAMVPFVQKKKDVLMTKGHMPDTFLTRLEAKQTSFIAARALVDAQKEESPVSTDTKIIANNDLKKRAMAVIKDAPMALIKKKDIAKKFVWATVSAQVVTPKPTGLAGKIKDAATEAPLSIVTANIAALGLSVTSDKAGRYAFASLPAGTYSIEFKADGYKTVVIDAREVMEGVTGRLNVVMESVGALVLEPV